VALQDPTLHAVQVHGPIIGQQLLS
jgi:hypothetical protein